MKNSAMHILSRHVRTLRRQRSWTQTELAKRADLAQTLISQLERGLKAPTVNTIESIAEAFGVPPWTLFLDIPDIAAADIAGLSSVIDGYASLPDPGRREIDHVVAAELRYHSVRQ